MHLCHNFHQLVRERKHFANLIMNRLTTIGEIGDSNDPTKIKNSSLLAIAEIDTLAAQLFVNPNVHSSLPSDQEDNDTLQSILAEMSSLETDIETRVSLSLNLSWYR